MALDLETIKSLQVSLTEMSGVITFITKIEEAKEMSFTVAGITTKISSKDEENFNNLQSSILESNYKKLDNLQRKIIDLIHSPRMEDELPIKR
jgi:hypothetical protein